MNSLPGTTSRRRIFLMRHGHVDYFNNGTVVADPRLVHLTEHGRAQARAAGIIMSKLRFDRAICSGLPRTYETAALVLGAQNEAPFLEIDPELEEIHVGRAADSHGQAPPPMDAKAMTLLFERADLPGMRMGPGGELFQSAFERAIGSIERLLAQPGWSRALVVAHGGINRMILGWMTGGGLSAMSVFEQDLACINILDFDVESDHDEGEEDFSDESIAIITRKIIKGTNLTADNAVKIGMYLTSTETIFKTGLGR